QAEEGVGRQRASRRDASVGTALAPGDQLLLVVRREEIAPGVLVVKSGIELRDQLTRPGELITVARGFVEVHQRARQARMVVKVGAEARLSGGPHVVELAAGPHPGPDEVGRL